MQRPYLKRFLPRGFYGRATLILLVPVVCIVLIASYGVIQRHYEAMTRQMTGIFARTAAHVLDRIDAAPDRDQAAARAIELGAAFDLQAQLLDPGVVPLDPDGARRNPLALSDRIIEERLRDSIAGLRGLVLTGNRVTLWLDSRHGPLVLTFPANTVSPRNPHQLLVIVLLGSVLMSAVGFVFLKNQVRPILRLARAAEAFGLGKSVPYRPSGALEVRSAGHAFLQMRDRIEQHIDQRTLMLSGVSHDLRTPLTRLRLALSLLEGEPETAAMLQDIAQMEALIDRLLDFARAEAEEPTEATDLIAQMRQAAERAQRSGGVVVLEGLPDGQPVMVPLRPYLFARGLDNLIENALRYGDRAHLRFRPAKADTGPVVEVEDDGPGIAPDDRAAALRPFVRLDKARGAGRGARGQAMGGVGLGLAIAADAMRSHGGRLELTTGSAPGLGGLCARLVFPVTRADGAWTGTRAAQEESAIAAKTDTPPKTDTSSGFTMR